MVYVSGRIGEISIHSSFDPLVRRPCAGSIGRSSPEMGPRSVDFRARYQALSRSTLSSMHAGCSKRWPAKWCQAKGPLGTAKLELARLGWEWPRPFVWTTHQDHQIDLMKVSPTMVLQHMALATRHFQGQRLAKTGRSIKQPRPYAYSSSHGCEEHHTSPEGPHGQSLH